MSMPRFTDAENELLIWLSYQNIPVSGPNAGLAGLLLKMQRSGNSEAEAYLTMLQSGGEEYRNLSGFTLKAISPGDSAGYQGACLEDAAGNRIVLNRGTSEGVDWGVDAIGGATGYNPQLGPATKFYEDNRSKVGYTYVVGDSLGGALTLATLLRHPGDNDSYGFVTNSGDFDSTSSLFRTAAGGLAQFAAIQAWKAEMVRSGRLRMAQTGGLGEPLSWISFTRGEARKGRFNKAGHCVDRRFMLLDVDTDQALELMKKMDAALERAEAIHVGIERIGPAILQDARDAVRKAVTPEKPMDVLTAISIFPSTIGKIVAPILPAIINGGGWLEMSEHLHFDFDIHSNRMRKCSAYFKFVASEVEACDSALNSSTRWLTS